MSKRAMLGGTFNPPHKTHIAMAVYAMENLGFDEVIVIPTATPPHKAATEIEPFHRYEMAKLAFAEVEGVTVSDIEQRRGGKSYTYDTAHEIGPVALLMGEDMFVTLESWHRASELLQIAEIVVFPRPGETGEIEGEANRLKREYGTRITVANMPLHPDSSTKIRSEIAAGRRPEGVPDAVLSYVKEKNLYVSNRKI